MAHQLNRQETSKKLTPMDVFQRWGDASTRLIVQHAINGNGKFAVMTPNGVLERFELVIPFEIDG